MCKSEPQIEVGKPLTQQDDPKLASYRDVTHVYEAELKNEDQENLVAVFLSSSNHVIGDALVFRGSYNRITIRPREIVRKALLLNAAAIILVHNHPDGEPDPTQSDIDTTKEVKDCLNTFDISLLDHVIVSPRGCYSMKQNNAL